MHADFPGLVEAGAGPERADELRRRDRAGFDVGREADAEQSPLLARGLLVGPELPVVEHLEDSVERRAVVAAVVADGDVRLIGAGELRMKFFFRSSATSMPRPRAPASTIRSIA